MLDCLVEGKVKKVPVQEVYHFPTSHFNLLSLGKIDGKGLSILIRDGNISI